MPESVDCIGNIFNDSFEFCHALYELAMARRPVDHDGPNGQLVDFGSRFGIWWNQDSRYFGIDHGSIASQRVGRYFMAAVARLGVLNVDFVKYCLSIM